MKVIILIAFSIVATNCTAQTSSQPYEAADAFRAFRSGVFHVAVENEDGLFESDSTVNLAGGGSIRIEWRGTGFLLNEDCLIGASRHLFYAKRTKNNVPVDTIFVGNRVVIGFTHPHDLTKRAYVETDLIYEDKRKDLAFLQPKNCGPIIKDRHVYELEEPRSLYDLGGESVHVIGHPGLVGLKSDVPVIRSGIVALGPLGTPSALLLDLIGVGGYSGSPVILKSTGRVIGMVASGDAQGLVTGFTRAYVITSADLEDALSQ